MAELVGPKFSVVFENIGRTYESFIDYSLDSGYTTSTDGFSFTLRVKDRTELESLLLEPVAIYVNGVQQCLGRIERTDRGNDVTAVRFTGRDYLADMVECMVDPAVTVAKGMTLDQVIKEAASVIGIKEVMLDDELKMRDFLTGKSIGKGGSTDKSVRTPTKKKDFKKLRLEDYKPNKSEGLFEYLNRIVARHGATIQPANSRDTVIVTAPNYEQSIAYSIQRKIDPQQSIKNNIIRGEASRDYSKFPTFVLVKGHQGGGGSRRTNITSLLNIGDNAYPNEIEKVLKGKTVVGRLKKGEFPPAGQLYRLLYAHDDDARNDEQIESTAKRLLADRLKDALIYTATVKGHHDPVTGRIYAPDTIIRVDDDITSVHFPMWLESRTFNNSPGQGATTTLTCWLPGAFLIE